jgi:hypothetical protein
MFYMMKFKPRRTLLSVLFVIGFAIALSFMLLKLSTQLTTDPNANPSALCQKNSTSFARTELLFGMSKPKEAVITETEFQHFVDREVTPRFPDGLTVLSAIGQFKNTDQAIVKEKSKLLLLLYPVNQDSDRSIEQIRQAYQKQFQQQSVLRVDARSCVAF